MLDDLMIAEPKPIQSAMLLYHQGMSLTKVCTATGLDRMQLYLAKRKLSRRTTQGMVSPF